MGYYSDMPVEAIYEDGQVYYPIKKNTRDSYNQDMIKFM